MMLAGWVWTGMLSPTGMTFRATYRMFILSMMLIVALAVFFSSAAGATGFDGETIGVEAETIGVEAEATGIKAEAKVTGIEAEATKDGHDGNLDQGNNGAIVMERIYEAESSANLLTGRAKVVFCGNCSGNFKVGDLYQGSGILFRAVNVDVSGYYRVSVDYISGDPRPAYVSVNGGPHERYDFPSTGDWQTVGRMEVVLLLRRGENTILFSDQDWYSPDIDRIVVHELLLRQDDPADQTDQQQSRHQQDPASLGRHEMSGESGERAIDLGERVDTSQFGSVSVVQYQRGFTVSNDLVTIYYDTTQGLASYGWHGEVKVSDTFSRVKVLRGSDVLGDESRGVHDDGNSTDSDNVHAENSGVPGEQVETISSRDAVHRELSFESVDSADDPLGTGLKAVVTSRMANNLTMIQSFHVYENQPFFVTRVEVVSEDGVPVGTNHIAPIVMEKMGGVDIGQYDDARVLVVPFDNDKWSRYQARTINTPFNTEQYISSELTAIFDNTSRNGLIIGSVTHDTWKTGIYWSGSNDRLNQLEVYGGFTSETSTHDTIAHGVVSGTRLDSPAIFVGFYDDYREGLTEFGKANAAISPPLAFPPGVPEEVVFGWNSWGALKSNVTFDIIAETSHFFKDHLQHVFHNQGRVYINLDSYWDNLNDTQLARLVELIRANGQIPGIYWAPFAYWGSNMKQFVEGTDYKYTYGDIVLRDENGNILPTLDGAYAVDPTHPGTKQRIDHFIGRFKRLGFEYIKLDFLSHGALEGAHYDPQVMTGIQAYNQGMAYVLDQIDGTMIIAASIAPLFPSQYAHSRRISCDVDGTLALTEYQLNNLTYGWWQHGTIYPFTDPDYMTLATAGSYYAAQSRVNSAVISGTVFLSSDDVRNPAAQELMKALLTNPDVNALAASGKVFIPVEGNTGDRAADVFVRHDDDGVSYVAVFNFSNNMPATKTIVLERAGLRQTGYRAVDVWTGEETRIGATDGSMHIELAPGQSKLLRLETH